jgi:hypothetical protein
MDRDVTIYTSSTSSPDDDPPSARSAAEVEGSAPESTPAPVSADAEVHLAAEPGRSDWWSRPPALVGAAVVAVGALVVAAVTGGIFAPDGPQAAWRSAQPAVVASPSPSAPPDDTITLAGVGDVIMGAAPGSLPRNGGEGFFDPVKKSLAADLVMGNLETPLTDDTGVVKCRLETPSPSAENPSPKPRPAEGCHQFRVPPSYAGHLRDAGFQVMNVANNHMLDHGQAGLDNTRAALAEVGIEHTGAAGQITVVRVKDVKVAVIGFSIYSWTQNLNDISGSVKLVKKAAKQADLVVVQMQGGAEGADRSHVVEGHENFLGEDRGDLITFTHRMIDAGADVVFGHGPHIMRGMEFYKGRLIAYSLGNFCGYGVLSSVGYLGVGGILKVTLHKDGTWADGTLIPTEMVGGGYVAVDKEKRAIEFVNDLSRSDFGDSAARLDSKGKISPSSP